MLKIAQLPINLDDLRPFLRPDVREMDAWRSGGRKRRYVDVDIQYRRWEKPVFHVRP